MRKGLSYILLVAALLAGCDGNAPRSTEEASEANGQNDTTLLSIAVTPTLDCLPLFVASDHHLFEKQGLQVRLDSYQSQMDQDTALAASRVSGMTTDLVRAERLRGQGTALSYATATQASWQLLTSRTARIKQPHQLRDKMVAMTRFSATHLLCDLMVDSAKLPTEHVFRIQVNDVAVRLNMLQVGNMDALLLPEPQATAARNMKAHVLYDTRPADLWLGVMVFREKAVDANRLRLLQKVYDEACDSLNERGLAAYADVIMRRCNVSRRTVDSLPTHLNYPHWQQPRDRDLQRAQEWLKKNRQ
ncbi:MAG: ABC transporter substrate-binding protein [Prevotella sp.]|nr:ABC transporter substrate-binding protein [Prevotella sp.]